MVLRRLLFTLLNNAQVIEKLSESRPIRRAAQITAYAIIKARIAGKDATTKLLKSNTVRQIRQETSGMPSDMGEMGRRAERLRQTFVKEVKEGVRERFAADKKGQMKPGNLAVCTMKPSRTARGQS